MPNAVRVRDANEFELKAGATYAGGQVIELPTGEPAYLDTKDPLASGSYSDAFTSASKATVEKATSVALLAGQEGIWDRSAGELTYRKVNDRDYRAGIIVRDADEAAITAELDIGKAPRRDIDLARDWFDTTIIGTQGLNTMGLFPRGAGCKLILSSTNEAQKADILSRDGFEAAAKWIAEFVIAIPNGGAGAAPDCNIGVASGTHATDADSIAKHGFFHIDGNSVNINVQTKDGTTTNAAADTTIDLSAGSAVANRLFLQIDGRNLADVRFYINGARVLSGTTFDMSAAAGTTLFLLAHLEKTAAADQFEADVESAWVRFSEQ